MKRPSTGSELAPYLIRGRTIPLCTLQPCLNYQCRLFLGFHHHLALIAMTYARGRDVWVIREREVHDPAFIGRHGFEGDRASAVGNPLGDLACQISQRIVPALLVARHVHEQVNALSHPLRADEAHDELERTQRFTPPADQQTGVLAVNLDDRTVHLFVVRLLEVYGGRDVHALDEVFQYLRCSACEVRGLLDERHPDSCGLSSNAEDARLAAINDVDFDLAALGV